MSKPRDQGIRPRTCANCGRALPTPKGTGRPRKTCGDKCRQRNRRRRNAVPWPPAPNRGFPSDPQAIRRRTAAAIVALLEGQPAAPAEDQLAQGLLEVDWIAYRFQALERELPSNLAGPTGELGRRIREMRRELFPSVKEATE